MNIKKVVFNDLLNEIIENHLLDVHFKKLDTVMFTADVMRKLCVQEKFFQEELRKSGVMANILDSTEIMISYIDHNAAKISKTPFKMEDYVQKILILLINFVTQNKKNQKY